MKITNIRVERTENKVSLLADCKIRPIGMDTLYFSFDKKYESYLYADASPFATALLVPCMHRGEDLIIEGSISKELYDGMQNIMNIMFAWSVGLKRINIKVENLTQDSGDPKRVATFFSGGVDSFYTYLKHQKDKKDPIDHLILINGNDIDLRNKRLWNVTRGNVREVAKEAKISVIEIETNIQALLEPMFSPNYTHGGLLAGAGLCLRNGLKLIYIPSSFNREQSIPWGSHLSLDHRWSTEILRFVHDGDEAGRYAKVKEISKSSIALKYLRVCYMNNKGEYNCGSCDKCIRTMTSLYIAGKLSESSAFPHDLDLYYLTSMVAHSGFAAIGHQENLDAIKESGGNFELKEAIEKGLAKVTDPHRSAQELFIKRVIYFDHMYFRGKFYTTWSNMVRKY